MMETTATGAIVRAALLSCLALGVWALARYETKRPEVLPPTASPQVFAAGRAEAVLGRILGPERPHPASSAENEAVRGRILHEYATLGIHTTTYRALGCNLSEGRGVLVCATVTDILADVRKGAGKSLVLLSHYDSVPAGPGASDDESGVATGLETIRALIASGEGGGHPILAVNTDGEEFGLLGAASFLDNPAFRARVGAVVNVEARGNHGPSLLFQTSPGDGPLIDLYAASVPTYATSSLFAVIYKLLPNDTDLTLFIHDGFPSVNFAFSDNVAHYHTALDRRENLDPQTFQMHGDNMLGVARALDRTDFAKLNGHDSVYISILGRWLPRLPVAWSLPLSVAAFLILLGATFAGANSTVGATQWVKAILILPALVLGCGVTGWLLHETAVIVSGQPDPSYAFPATLRLALGLGVVAVTVLVSRLSALRPAGIAIWLTYSILALLTAALIPGLSPYFLFPVLPAGIIFLLYAGIFRSWRGPVAEVALLVAAAPALVIWLSLGATGESLNGLAVHPLVTIPAAFALATLVPLMRFDKSTVRTWGFAVGALFLAAFGVAAIAGTRPAYSAIAPLRLDFNYVEDTIGHRTFWAADAHAPLPSSISAVMRFSTRAERPFPFAYQNSYTAPAGAPRYEPPTASITSLGAAHGVRRIAVSLHGTNGANQMVLLVPKAAELKGVSIDGKHFAIPDSWASLDRNLIGCFSDDCRSKTIILEIASHAAAEIVIGQQTYGLPAEGRKLMAARPEWATVSQNGDTTVLINKARIPPG